MARSQGRRARRVRARTVERRCRRGRAALRQALAVGGGAPGAVLTGRVCHHDSAARVLRPGGIAIAAGINRIAFLRDMFRSPDAFPQAFFQDEFTDASASLFRQELPQRGFIAEFLATGNLDPLHAPPIGYAHLTTVAGFRELLGARFEELALVGAGSYRTVAGSVALQAAGGGGRMAGSGGSDGEDAGRSGVLRSLPIRGTPPARAGRVSASSPPRGRARW
jgi:hypothetical protein